MEDYLKLFEITSDYEEYIDGDDALLPNVSYCEDENKVHFNPIVPPYQGFCKLMLQDNTIVEIEGSGELTEAMITDYLSTCVSAEIGALCTSIGTFAFRNCTSLTSVIISNSVTSIGGSAFYQCSGLTSVNIPDSVTNIGSYAFYYCSNLVSIISLATTAPTIISSTFQNIKTSGTLTVPSGSSGYDVWMGTGNYYLGKYNWTKVEQ